MVVTTRFDIYHIYHTRAQAAETLGISLDELDQSIQSGKYENLEVKEYGKDFNIYDYKTIHGKRGE